MANQRLINVKHCREYALRMAETHRPEWQATRISSEFLDDLDTKVRWLIYGAVQKHPSTGKTISELQ